MATRIILVRHGETDWNAERRWQGHSDRPLTELGREQAAGLADELAQEPISAVFASDLMRAHETARIVAERLDLDVTAVPGLRERQFGSWEGLRDIEVEERFPGLHGPPDGESREAMAARVLASLDAIAGTHPGQTVLVVSHGGPIRAILRHHAHPDCEEPVANCAVVRLDLEVH